MNTAYLLRSSIIVSEAWYHGIYIKCCANGKEIRPFSKKYFKFVTAVGQNKCHSTRPGQITNLWHYTCAPIAELPSDISILPDIPSPPEEGQANHLLFVGIFNVFVDSKNNKYTSRVTSIVQAVVWNYLLILYDNSLAHFSQLGKK